MTTEIKSQNIIQKYNIITYTIKIKKNKESKLDKFHNNNLNSLNIQNSNEISSKLITKFKVL